jgi:hypothetical protein
VQLTDSLDQVKRALQRPATIAQYSTFAIHYVDNMVNRGLSGSASFSVFGLSHVALQQNIG